MMKKTEYYPKATRPGEYIAFFTVQLSTKEGPAYLFLAVDAYSEFAFHLGVESDDKNENFLKYIYLLMEDANFLRHRDKGFTLVLEKHEELSEQINAIINNVNGTLLINKSYNNYISMPLLKSLSGFMKSKK